MSPDYLFIDDFHRAESEQTSAIVRRLVSGLRTTTLVLSCRAHPGDIGTAELRAQGRLLELTQNDLQFSASEVDQFLGDLINQDERDQYCADLAARTEGWPIALQAIRQLIKTGCSTDEALQLASGRSGLLSDYFIEQVFDTLPDEHQKLLLSTAMFERVNGDLGDAICGTNSAWALLDELEKNDVFIQSLDPERQWYRYHRLFAEFIGERARRSVEIDTVEIARRAANWFQTNGYPTDALQYAMMSDDAHLIAKTLAGIGGWRQAMMGNLIGVTQAIENLSEHDLRSFPTVWMADIYAKLKTGDYASAAEAYNALSETYQTQAEQDADLRNEMFIIRALLIGYRDEPNRIKPMVALLDEMGTTAPRDDHYLHAMRFNTLCFFCFRIGHFSRAIAAGEASIYHYRRVGSVYGETFVYFHECFTFYLQGRLRDANATLEQGLELSASHFGIESDLYAIGSAFGALLAYEQNDFAKTQKFLNIALPKIEQSDAWTEVYIAAYTAALSLAGANKDWDQVDLIYRGARLTANARQLLRVEAFVDDLYNDLKRRDSALNETPADTTPLSTPSANILSFDGLQKITAFGRRLIHAERFPDAVTFLSQHTDNAREKKLNRAFITLSLLLAIAHRGCGDIDQASECFNDVLSYAMFEDFRRPIIDEGPQVLQLIKDIESRASQQRHNRLRDNFLAALLVEINAEQKGATTERKLLSEREQAVLRSLIHGRTNKETSEALGISQNTVKFHLKNVYQKLGVSSRQEAVRLSLRDGLI